MPTIVDARGQVCPQPVILTKKALATSSDVITIVDNETSRYNVSRMAEKQGCRVQVEERQDGVYLHITRGEIAPETTLPPQKAPPAGPLVILIGADTLGRGDDTLGGVLMRSFLHTLGETTPLPDAMIFINSGVKLVVSGSPVLEDLLALRNCGVQILACGTCLGHYGLKERVAVGEVSNMYTIVEALLAAGKVLRV